MKNVVKYLIIVLCLLIVCVIILLISYNTKNIDNMKNEGKRDEFVIEADNNIAEVSFNNEIMNIKECIQNYIENRNLHV